MVFSMTGFQDTLLDPSTLMGESQHALWVPSLLVCKLGPEK